MDLKSASLFNNYPNISVEVPFNLVIQNSKKASNHIFFNEFLICSGFNSLNNY